MENYKTRFLEIHGNETSEQLLKSYAQKLDLYPASGRYIHRVSARRCCLQLEKDFLEEHNLYLSPLSQVASSFPRFFDTMVDSLQKIEDIIDLLDLEVIRTAKTKFRKKESGGKQ
ncbi:hypothetical protein KA107_01375 [Candidatus Pacearchaeota archaeon]|nr:hypothetical protein [Candidatus Pacearchaeota archaeon]